MRIKKYCVSFVKKNKIFGAGCFCHQTVARPFLNTHFTESRLIQVNRGGARDGEEHGEGPCHAHSWQCAEGQNEGRRAYMTEPGVRAQDSTEHLVTLAREEKPIFFAMNIPNALSMMLFYYL